MPVYEKKRISLRYIWCIFIYSLSGCLIMLTLLFAKNIYNMADIGKLNGIYQATLDTSDIMLGEEFIVIATVFSVIFLAVCVGELAAFCNFFAYEFDRRRNARWYLWCLGYRRRDIIRYEEAYFLFDAFCSVIGAVVLTRLFEVCLERTKFVQAILEAEKTSNLQDFSIYGIVGASMVLAVAAEVAFCVWRESGRAFSSRL